MTPELIAILAVGAALAGVVLQGQRGLGARMDRLDARMDRFEGRMDRLETEIKEVRDRLSRLEAKVDLLERHIVRPDEAPAPAQ